ncbi:MAG: molybdopterin cofactor-binding domain-containing protein, partial [Hyphomicrobium sp.]
MLHYLEQARQALEKTGASTGTSEAQPALVIENVSRRSFLGGALTTTGVAIAMQMIPANKAEAVTLYPHGGLTMPNGVVTNPNVFIAIAPDGTVTIMAHRSEMGTGAKTALPMIIADEMEADWSRVKVVQAPGDEPKYGNQDTDGSRSVRHYIQPMRVCGASMRQMLEAAAAAQWGVDAALCKAKNHTVVLLKDSGGGKMVEAGKSIGYGDLAKVATALPVPAIEKVVFKKP